MAHSTQASLSAHVNANVPVKTGLAYFSDFLRKDRKVTNMFNMLSWRETMKTFFLFEILPSIGFVSL